jgi:hypothetical protein
LTIKYAIERVDINEAQLASWRGWIDGRELNLAGPCPVCTDDTKQDVDQEFTALEVVAQSRQLAVSVACACGQPHDGQPSGVTGCGRHWSCTATTSAGNTVTLSPLSDPQLVAAADELREAGATQLANLRSAAEKWIGGVTGLFGLFSLAGVITSRSTVTNLAVGWQVIIAIVAAISVALAGLAVFWIYRAAYGWPVTRVIADNDELLNWYAAREAAPRVQAGYLRDGVRVAGGALTALVVTAGLLWFAPQQQPTVPMVQVTLTNGSQVCGTLLPATPGATLVRRASDGTAVDITPRSIEALTVVAACLGAEQVLSGQAFSFR